MSLLKASSITVRYLNVFLLRSREYALNLTVALK